MPRNICWASRDKNDVARQDVVSGNDWIKKTSVARVNKGFQGLPTGLNLHCVPLIQGFSHHIVTKVIAGPPDAFVERPRPIPSLLFGGELVPENHEVIHVPKVLHLCRGTFPFNGIWTALE